MGIVPDFQAGVLARVGQELAFCCGTLFPLPVSVSVCQDQASGLPAESGIPGGSL